MTDLLVSFSGGRTSAYMCWLLLTNPKYRENFRFHFVFANTGKEKEKTLIFVDQCDKYFGLNLTWVEALVHPEEGVATTHKFVDFETASRKGEPFEDVIKKYGIPNKAFPHCTRELKQRPIHSYMKQKMGGTPYRTAIGIRIDEARRVKKFDEKLFYPLIEQANWIVEHQIIDFWKKMPFDLQLKPYEGNCDLCWKKSVHKKHRIIEDDPTVVEWWIDMEEKYSEGKYFFHRSNESTAQLDARKGTELTLFTDSDEMNCTCRESLTDEPQEFEFEL